MKLYFSFLLISFLPFISIAQQKYSLSGKVTDKKGEVLPGTGVFISGYKIATSTNAEGYFNLNLPVGNFDILIKAVGYKPFTKNLTVVDKNLSIAVSLEESTIALNEVVVRPDPNRENYINIFKDFFLGTTPNSAKCKLLNPSVLNVEYNKEERVLNVDCSELLIIENKALGYEIKYLIKNFQLDYKTNIVYYEGYPYYKDLEGSDSKKLKWAEARLASYNGSPQHFFKSLYLNNSQKEGFNIYELVKQENKNRLPDSLIKEKIKQFKHEIDYYPNKKEYQDSLNFWIGKGRVSRQIIIFKGEEILADTLVHQQNKNVKYINFQNILTVEYQNEKPDIAMGNSFKAGIPRLEKFKDHQLSLLNLLIRPVYFYANGAIFNPKSLLFEGTWAWEKIADSVPMDYLPPLSK
ncbi:hypothetical protein A5893_01535 [Pedobacter psychrophilus]|uniref:Carboxypeptidase-like regulatory domain-containing protein n=1 Tax=Pedobacter psychrophilus TaxID=1826909 RepID=A0A179DL43_9SPHI|nr:carboxypeptidase-like regulatory domain-containing protein [Pedobacter psychrophilus]OAQ41826.1 hypothetical protein A5893_01535 [Pedobacter psychrophilus]